nr:hypothetical protein [Tanacetum cinerariifolium]
AATWDGGKGTWGGRAKGFGTVPVVLGAHEIVWGNGVKMEGKCVEGLDLTYATSTITTQQPTEGKLDLLFEAMYDDYIGGQPSATPQTNPAAQAHQVRQTLTTSTSIADTAPTLTNSSSQATNFPNTSQDVDGLNSQQQHAQQQGIGLQSSPKQLLIIFQMLCSM